MNTSSKKISLKSCCPVIWSIGRMVMPFDGMSIRNWVSPCRRFSLVVGEVRNSAIM